MYLAANSLDTWTWYSFTRENLLRVPNVAGVYCLGIGNDIIYIGCSSDLFERLKDHFYTDDPCIAQANQFAIYPCSDYMAEEHQRLLWHLRTYGRLPKCNDRT